MSSRNVKRGVSVAREAPVNTRLWVRRLLVTPSALLLFTLFSGEIRDTDIWLHLKTGQHTLETRALTVVPNGGSFGINPISITSTALGRATALTSVPRRVQFRVRFVF